MGGLIQAEEAGDKLSEDELFGMVFLLLTAGHETTFSLSGIGTLLRHFPKPRLAVAPVTLTWRPGALIRGLHQLPVAFD